MNFILNKAIKFTPDISELSVLNEDQNNIILSKSANRLLNTLIQSVGIVVTREDLLKNVWEDYGFTPSHNNLYMAISEIRKAFVSLGCDNDLIITIPKVGLKLIAPVDIIDGKKIDAQEKLQPKSRVNTWGKILTLLSILIATSSFSYYKMKTMDWLPIKSSTKQHIFQYGTCEIFSQPIVNKERLELFKSDVIRKLKEHKIACKGKNVRVYFQTILNRSETSKETFMGICTTKDTKQCENLKEITG